MDWLLFEQLEFSPQQRNCHKLWVYEIRHYLKALISEIIRILLHICHILPKWHVITDRILVVKQRNMGKVIVMEVVECQNFIMARQTQKWWDSKEERREAQALAQVPAAMGLPASLTRTPIGRRKWVSRKEGWWVSDHVHFRHWVCCKKGLKYSFQSGSHPCTLVTGTKLNMVYIRAFRNI